MADRDVDLFVIGGGSGGVRAARIAAGHGARVMVAEEYRLGGTCVIRGCVPKKLLVYASRFRGEFEDAAGFGWTVPDAFVRLADADRQQGPGDRAARSGLYVDLAKGGRHDRQEPRAILDDAHTVRLTGDGERVRAKHILIATGGTPSLGDEIPGHRARHLLERGVPSQGVAAPRRGPGRRLSSPSSSPASLPGLAPQVTLVYRGEHILRGFDDDVRQHLRVEMEKRGIKVITGCTVAAIETGRRALFACICRAATR